MHKVNLMEVYYDIFREHGQEKADAMLAQLPVGTPIRVISHISDELFKEAGKLKATCRISFADTFALALTKNTGGTLLTSDHHEFEPIEKNGYVPILWIR